MAKNKGKRNRSQRNSAPSNSLTGGGSVTSGSDPNPGETAPEGRPSTSEARLSRMSIEPTPSSDNVIPFPRSSLGAEARDGKATYIAGTGSFPTPRVPSDAAAEVAKAEAPPVGAPPAESALRPAAGEHERTTIPPDEATGERAKAAAPEVLRTPEAEAKPVERITDRSVKPADDEAHRTLRGEIIGRKDESRRPHKESLSTHLSDEARAFFSEAAAVAAYKQTHDTFEDLAPASEDHAAELARSKRAMTITGALLVGVIAVVAGFGIYSRTSVPETGLAQTSTPVTPVAPAVADPTPPPVTDPAAPPAVEPAPVAAPTAVAAPEAAPPAPGPTPGPSAVAATPVVAPEPTPVLAPVPAAPTPVAAPSGRTPQQLLAAARAFRGPFAGKLAAYNAYFDANPTDDRAMATYSMSLAESAHHAEAEAVARRAVTANPRNGQAWFVLAYARSRQRNREGAAEARTRCIAIGGTWAAECRALR